MKTTLFMTLCCVFSTCLGLPQQTGFNYNRNSYNLPLNSNSATTQNQPQQQQQQQQQQYIPQQNRNVVPITSYNNEIAPDGSFSYGYSSGDGQAQVQAFVKSLGAEQAQVVQGSYSYTSPDGTPINVMYVADENGFRAEGLHLPTPPPIPEAIQRALQYIARVQGSNPPQYRQNQSQYTGTNDQSGAYNKFG